MFKKIKTIIMSLAAVLVIAAPATVPVVAFADASTIQNGLCAGSNLTVSDSGSCTVDSSGTQDKVNNLLTTVVNIFSVVVGVVAVIMIIVGGLRYITSGGDSSKVGGAKNSIIYAIVGLVIVALAQFIVHYVLAKATSLT